MGGSNWVATKLVGSQLPKLIELFFNFTALCAAMWTLLLDSGRVMHLTGLSDDDFGAQRHSKLPHSTVTSIVVLLLHTMYFTTTYVVLLYYQLCLLLLHQAY